MKLVDLYNEIKINDPTLLKKIIENFIEVEDSHWYIDEDRLLQLIDNYPHLIQLHQDNLDDFIQWFYTEVPYDNGAEWINPKLGDIVDKIKKYKQEENDR